MSYQLDGMKDGIKAEANSFSYDMVTFGPVSTDGKTIIVATFMMNDDWEEEPNSDGN